MPSKGIIGFFQRNVVMISGIGIIVATHWGWSKLQENPRLVPEEQRKDMPIMIGLQYMSESLLNKVTSFTDGGKEAQPPLQDKK